ncbi:hypothetical protein [Acinetobacter dispersus]|uniref:hypothetical protein n=1 Tax=Acinetobacter dispersus TaxID=70348 RepID=UPI0021CDE1B5|nr:hypothetical protein [Acinetobacter dispersus]MCU4336216.1 hypothetical protein [Acinetobacter dispersus]
MWNARIAGAEKLNNLIDVAFFADKSKDIAISHTERIMCCSYSMLYQQTDQIGHRWPSYNFASHL